MGTGFCLQTEHIIKMTNIGLGINGFGRIGRLV